MTRSVGGCSSRRPRPAETSDPLSSRQDHGESAQESVVVGHLDHPRLPRHRLSVIGIALHESVATGASVQTSSPRRPSTAGGVTTRMARMTLPSFSARLVRWPHRRIQVLRTRRVRRRARADAVAQE